MGSTGIANKAVTVCHDKPLHRTEATPLFQSSKRPKRSLQPSQPLLLSTRLLESEIPATTRCADEGSICTLSC